MMSENHLPFDRGLPPIAVRADVSPLLIAIAQVKGAILQLALGIGFFIFSEGRARMSICRWSLCFSQTM